MKKIFVFLFIALLTVSGVKAQTYEQTQDRVNSETTKLEKRLSEVKDRIYYLEVTLDEKITEAGNKYLLKDDIKRLKREKHFAADDLKSLNSEKIRLEQTLAEIKNIGLDGKEYRTENDMKSNLPEQMSARELKRRSRTQLFKLSEGGSDGSDVGPKMFKGLLVNYKTGQGEIAIFTINRTDIKGFKTITKGLNPQERLYVDLPVGDYRVDVVCGYNWGVCFPNVDPRVIKHFDQKDVYWFAAKLMTDN